MSPFHPKWQWTILYVWDHLASDLIHLGHCNQHEKLKKKMNHTLKKMIANLCQETHLRWDNVLSVAFLQVQITPRSRLISSPDNTVYKRPFLSTWGKHIKLKLEGENRVKQHVAQTGQILTTVHRFASFRSLPQMEAQLPSFSPGIMCSWKLGGNTVLEQWLTARWKEPYTVLLTTHSLLKLLRVKPWIHHTSVKKHLMDQKDSGLQ